MASESITSLDAWLAEADEVLVAGGASGLSPSEAGVDPELTEWDVSLRSFAVGLPGLLDRLCRRPGRWILIAEDVRHPSRYWQVLAFEDGSLLAEVGHGTPSSPDEGLDAGRTDRLEALGWEPPEPPVSPNWRRVEDTLDPEIADVADQAVRTLGDVLGLGVGDRVHLSLSPSPRRGGTAASGPPPSPSGPPAPVGPCPSCGAPVVPVVYGMPDGELFERADRGEVVLGGCVILPAGPTWQCRGPDAHALDRDGGGGLVPFTEPVSRG